MPGSNMTTKKRDYISASGIQTSNGTWTVLSNSGIPIKKRTALTTTKQNFALYFTVPGGQLQEQFGIQLVDIYLPLKLSVAGLATKPAVSVNAVQLQNAVNATSSNVASTAVAATFTGNIGASTTDTAWKISITNPAFQNTGFNVTIQDYVVRLSCQALSTTAFQLYDAFADNYIIQ